MDKTLRFTNILIIISIKTIITSVSLTDRKSAPLSEPVLVALQDGL